MTSPASAVPATSFAAMAPPFVLAPGAKPPAIVASSPAPALTRSALPAIAPSSPQTLASVLDQRRRRLDGWTAARVGIFLAALGETGSVTRAAEYANMSAAACYTLRNHAGGGPFAEAWDNALASRFEILSEMAMTRIRNGTERIRWYKGEKVGTDWIFSDRLLLAMIDRADPSRRGAGDAGHRTRHAKAGDAANNAPAVDGATATRRFDPVWDASDEPQTPRRGLLTAALSVGGDASLCDGARTCAEAAENDGTERGAGAGAAESASDHASAALTAFEIEDAATDAAMAAAAELAEDHLRPLSADERAAMAKPGTAFDDAFDYLDAEMRAAVKELHAASATRDAAAAVTQAAMDARFDEFLGPNKTVLGKITGKA